MTFPVTLLNLYINNSDVSFECFLDRYHLVLPERAQFVSVS